MSRRTRLLLLALAALVIGLGVLVFQSIQDRLVFYPEVLDQHHVFAFDAPFEEVWLDRPDGARVHALHFEPAETRGTILYFHGNAGSLASWGEVGAELAGLGFDVVIPDYRGFGKSSGRRSEDALHGDAAAWWEWTSGHGRGDVRIVYGRSIGSGLAVPLAAEVHPDRLILESPFLSLDDMARRMVPGVPVSLLSYRFRSDLAAPKVSCPVTIFHGTDDEVVPFSSGKALAAAFSSAQLTFVDIPGGHHNDLSLFPAFQVALGNALGR